MSFECQFNNLSFIDGIQNQIEFEVTDPQKRDTEIVFFNHCSAVDFIDIKILKRLPETGCSCSRRIGRIEKNEIDVILDPIFAKNQKLEYIDLTHDQIIIVHPKLFDDLPKLEEVRFEGSNLILKSFDKFTIHILKAVMRAISERR
jgi:hypothetical protein